MIRVSVQVSYAYTLLLSTNWFNLMRREGLRAMDEQSKGKEGRRLHAVVAFSTQLQVLASSR